MDLNFFSTIILLLTITNFNYFYKFPNTIILINLKNIQLFLEENSFTFFFIFLTNNFYNFVSNVIENTFTWGELILTIHFNLLKNLK